MWGNCYFPLLKALRITKQGALDLINPLLGAGLIVRAGTRKNGHYRLA